jgi:hypothetical protein
VASAVDLVRFASAFRDSAHCLILNEPSVRGMLARPSGPAGREANGQLKPIFCGCGWYVRPNAAGIPNYWHTGSLDGTSTLLLSTAEGVSIAVLFNTARDRKNRALSELIDPLLQRALGQVKRWPSRDLFSEYLSDSPSRVGGYSD